MSSKFFPIKYNRLAYLASGLYHGGFSFIGMHVGFCFCTCAGTSP